MVPRFTTAALLLWVTLAGLVLAMLVPLCRTILQTGNPDNMVFAVAASADGSTFGALLGDGRVLIWDAAGSLKTTLQTHGALDSQLALSSDGRWAAVSSAWDQQRAQQGSGVEVWDVETNKLVKRISSDGSNLAFSPAQNVLAVANGDDIEIHSVVEDTPPRRIDASGARAKFSADGRRIAVVGHVNGIRIYDTSSGEFLQKLAGDDGSERYYDVAWSLDGSTVAAVRVIGIGLGGAKNVLPRAPTDYLRVWRLNNGASQTAAPHGDDAFETLIYLPGGRALAVAGGAWSILFLDSNRFTPVLKERTAEADQIAAGVRGDTFLTSGASSVDLWDLATLRPRRRVFESAPAPNILPAAVGLLVWFIFFNVRRARKYMRPCQTCGQRYQPNGPNDTNVDCPNCRRKAEVQRLPSKEAARQQRQDIQRGWIVLLLFDGFVAAGFALAARNRLGFWPAFVTAALLQPALLYGFLYARLGWRLFALKYSTGVALADEVAGAPGTTRQIGDMLVWSAEGTSLAELLEVEIGVARQRLEAATGRTVPAPTAPAFIFTDSDMLARYLKRLCLQIDEREPPKNCYFRGPGRRLLLSERSLREEAPDSRVVLRLLVAQHLIDTVDGRRVAAWIDQGLTRALSHDDDHHELARLNRRIIAGRLAGRTVGARELLSRSVRLLHRFRGDLEYFAWSNQFASQAWSVMEFLCGRGSTPERRLAFQSFFADSDRGKWPERTIARHFGCSFEEILTQWEDWVDEQGAGEHHPPPARIASYLLDEPIARLASADTRSDELVAAIRELSGHGYLLGADRVIALLESDHEEIRAEAVWALECISGCVLGRSAADWRPWWERSHQLFGAA